MSEFVKSCVSSVASWIGGAEPAADEPTVDEPLEVVMEGMDVTPSQMDPLRDDQVKNNAGGFGWRVSDMDRLRRFLVLGSEGGTYYVKEKELSRENAKCIQRLIKKGKGVQVVEQVLEFSLEGRAAKQEPIIFTLAMCARDSDSKTKEKAYDALCKVCRIPTHLFSFVEYTQALSEGKGWGRAQRRAIEKWYNSRTPKALAMAVTKYVQRNGWTHRDLARLSHLQPHTKAHALIYRYMVRGYDEAVIIYGQQPESQAAVADAAGSEVVAMGDVAASGDDSTEQAMDTTKPAVDAAKPEAMDTTQSDKGAKKSTKKKAKGEKTVRRCKDPEVEDNAEQAAEVLTFLGGVEEMKKAKNEREVCSLIMRHGLVREHVPSEFLNSVLVWETLLKDMPMTAMLRNLAKMTSIDLLKPLGNHTKTVCDRLRDHNALRRARVHPFDVLLAMTTYKSGRGLKGRLSWKPVQEVVQALDDAFYASFRSVEPTGKRFLLALDVSGSMWGARIMNSNITAAEASACMAMVTARTEKRHHIVGFSHKLVNVDISPTMRLDSVLDVMNRISMGSTDCAQPMLYAMERNLDVDVFIVYTDCETWSGRVHPTEALKRYRRKRNLPNAKLIVVATTSSGFTIADPDDRNMLDMVGFDAAGPSIIREFSLGKI